MISTILRLFRFTPFLQMGLSSFCFCSLLILILIRLFYAHGLTSSFSNNIPHLTVKLIEGETQEAQQIDLLTQIFQDTGEIKAISPFRTGNKILKMETELLYLGGKNKYEAPTEILGVNWKVFPFVLPFELSRSLKNQDYHNSYTIKELGWILLHSENAMIINEAMANLFSPTPVVVDDYLVWVDNNSEKHLKVRILAVVKDLLDVPRLITNLETSSRLLDNSALEGVLVRLKDVQKLEDIQGQAQEKLTQIATVTNWREGHNRQQKLFQVFSAIFWLIIVVIVILAVIAGVLGIYRTFITKRKSLAVLLILGISQQQFLLLLAGINTIALFLGFGIAFSLLIFFQENIFEGLLSSLKEVVPTESIRLEWSDLLQWSGGLFFFYLFLFLLFLFLMLRNKNPLQ